MRRDGDGNCFLGVQVPLERGNFHELYFQGNFCNFSELI